MIRACLHTNKVCLKTTSKGSVSLFFCIKYLYPVSPKWTLAESPPAQRHTSHPVA